jgi:hypothetical protein
MITKTRIFAALLAAVFLASCSGAMHDQSVVPKSVAPKAATTAPIQSMVLENDTDGGGGCDAGFEKDVDPSSSTYGTCIPLPSSNETVYCGFSCTAWISDGGDPSGFTQYGFGGGASGVVDCSDPNNSADPSCLVALLNPTKGTACWQSPGVLGDQYPVNTTDRAHEITDIVVLMAKNASGAMDTLGWEYMTGDGGAMYFQENTSFKDFWDTVLNSNSITGTLLTLASTGGITPISSAQANNVASYLLTHNGKAGSCFTGKLPA